MAKAQYDKQPISSWVLAVGTALLAAACGSAEPGPASTGVASMEQAIDSVPTPESRALQEQGVGAGPVERRAASARVAQEYGVVEYRIQRVPSNRAEIQGIGRAGQVVFALVLGEEGLVWRGRSSATRPFGAAEGLAVDRAGNVTGGAGPDAALLRAKAAAVVQDLASTGLVPSSFFDSCWWLGTVCAAETISVGLCAVECATVVGCALCIASVPGALVSCHNWASQCGGSSGGGGGGSCRPCSVNRCCGEINSRGCCTGTCLTGAAVCP